MRDTARWMASAAGALALLCIAVTASAQSASLIGRVALAASGTIQGRVLDEVGLPVAGAMVSALGSSSASSVTDRAGHFELRALAPGPYLVRVHLSGFVAPRGQIVQVLPGVRASSSIAVRHASTGSAVSPPLVPAAVGPVSVAEPAPAGKAPSGTVDPTTPRDSDGEVAWRLRHARRSILNDAVEQVLIASHAPAEAGAFGSPRMFGRAVESSAMFGRAVESSARVASNFFTDTPFFGQFNLLTTNSFDAPQDLMTRGTLLAHSVANLLLGAPAGGNADWTVRGAVTQGDIASWVVSGDYVTRESVRHRYDLGLSYSTQRYSGGNFAALRDVTDGSRNVGTLHGFDTFAVTPAVSVTYGARLARYDYLGDGSLLSPRVGLTLVPADHLRVNAVVSRQALAPGAEEFVQPDTGIWLPPQRTFSSFADNDPLVAERTTHVEAELERDVAAGATVSVRAFRQRVSDQLVTLFGVDQPGRPSASLGHYFVANSGGFDASGYSAGIKAVLADRVHGSIEYSFARAWWNPAGGLGELLLVAPSAVRRYSETIHDVSTSIETDVPETSTHVVVVYRLNNRFAGRNTVDGPALDARFDVQVRQSLPFMDFSSAKWEMLVAVRNFFRDVSADQSLYDELLVVRPPKRVVGGLTLRF